MIAASHSLVNTMMTEHPKQLLHMDIVGPSRGRSMGGKWYVLVIVDDYSRYSWVFFLESKDEVFEHFCSLALRSNNEHPNRLKGIHNDNGTEFRNGSFDQFCLEHCRYPEDRVPPHTSSKSRQGAGRASTRYHVSGSLGPHLCAEVGSGAATCPAALDLASVLR
jgi:transposase InsO family protein